MAGRPYSTRFLSGRAPSVSAVYYVPAGTRAVVRFVSVTAWAATGMSFFLKIATVPVWYWQAPGANVNVFEDVRFVAYAGEAINIVTAGSDMSWAVSGFLFDDVVGAYAAEASYELVTEEQALEQVHGGELGRMMGPLNPLEGSLRV